MGGGVVSELDCLFGEARLRIALVERLEEVFCSPISAGAVR
jgi:hypothetical protein